MKRILSIVLTLSFVFSIGMLTGCSGKSSSTTAATTAAPTATTAEQTFTATFDSTKVAGKIVIGGSSSVYPIMQILADKYKKYYNPNATLEVSFVDSGAGVKGAGEKTLDIGMASRAVKDSELKTYPSIKPFNICYDGLAVIVNAANSVSDITKEQLKGVYTGTVTSWSDLGGADSKISPYGRESGSGTLSAFQEHVLGKAPTASTPNDAYDLYDDTVSPFNSTNILRSSVSTNARAIGYISFGSLNSSIKTLKVDGVACTVETIKDGSYALQRPFVLITNGDVSAQSKVVQDFINFIKSADGQKYCQLNGYVPL